MHFFVRIGLFFSISALPALAQTQPVRVAMPIGIATTDVSTAEATIPDREYVTIDGVRILNPSHHAAQGFESKDFHLIVGDRVYLPAPRPGSYSQDVAIPGTVAPGDTASVTVSFLIPIGTSQAKFEFTPHWMNDAGETVDWCCYYL